MYRFKNIKIKEVLIVVLILGITFGYYLDSYIFDLDDIEELDFYSIEGIFHYSKMKILIIAYCLIWYFTSKNWWRYSILVVIAIELMKLFSTFNSNQSNVDDFEYFITLPITLPIILIMIFISHKINQYNLAKQVRSEIDKEINETFFSINSGKKQELDSLHKKFIELKSENFSEEESIEYLKNLIKLRDEFYEI
ncbi:hypothetical protein [Psychroserpens luteolus]|uniref:hypothetical protein n=1 Tax=Psychroserpens luteolus TaxID=2855840 RepID=UPI001E4CE23E|nr:hypothetical protein [Psychroserpens luteolus]MCD2258908.1 hypothetical protein [Psychroserpens luteolus]